MSLYALGFGVGTHNRQGQWLDVYFPQPRVKPSTEISQALIDAMGGTGTLPLNTDKARALAALLAPLDPSLADALKALCQSEQPLVAVLLTDNIAPASVPEAYLKLHLLSHRLVKPHGTVLDGMFGLLPNVAWTNEGAIDLSELPARQLAARVAGKTLEVSCVDKFPKMTNYVVPSGVRIAHTARVRLGAYLGEGTTIMHEGFVNFNAGTEGPGMIEGRISAGVFVGKGSDLGGGCSTMGTLSGGGNIIISVGDNCLIGANAGIGIPLGHRCTVEAGLYLTAGAKVRLLDDRGELVRETKARELANQDDLLFRRNSVTGAIECKTNQTAIALNETLHANN